jgi:energy-converting hydrogenase Eha subunit H
MNYLKIAKRMLALFLVTALATVGAGAAIGIDVWQAALLAGIMGIANVVEDLARGYLNDGVLTDEEIDQAFVDNIPAED